MAEVIEMPRLSDTMSEGVITRWHKAVGEAVKPGDLLAEIETDKATMEFEAPVGGVLLYVGTPEGKPIPIGAPIAIIGKAGEDISPLLEKLKGKAATEVISSAPATAQAPAAKGMPSETLEQVAIPTPSLTSQSASAATSTDQRLKASPLAKAMAKEAGLDLSTLQGSGEGGRIIKRDVEAALAQKPAIGPAIASAYEETPLSQMRKTIAKRLTASVQQAPHFYLTVTISMENAIQWREKLNALSPHKISFNDLIIKACAVALRRHPYLNAAWLEDRIRLYKEVHIGFAVAVEEGLIVPVIRHADRKGLAEIAAETAALAAKARERKLSPEEYSGSTFSISNLGMFGIESFTAVINPPEAAILAVGAIAPVATIREGALGIERQMKVTLSCDHRVVDGATGAQFLQTLKALLEEPARLLL